MSTAVVELLGAVGSLGDIRPLRRERSLAQSTLKMEAVTEPTQPVSKLSTVTENILFTTFLMLIVALWVFVPSK